MNKMAMDGKDIIKQESHQQKHQHDHWLELKRLFLGF